MKKGRSRRKSKNSAGLLTGRIVRAVAVAAAILIGVLLFRGTLLGVPADQLPEAPEAGPPAVPDINPIEVELTKFDAGISDSIRLELLNVSDAGNNKNVDLSGTAPRVLIYHTHTTEAYTPTRQYAYTACGEWRTRQNDRNVVALGERLAELLRDKYGIAVLHDTTDHEPPTLKTAYERSLTTMQKYKKQYPSITMFIDLHRDAGAGGFVTINGKEVAQMMFVVGTGKGATGTGYAEMPDFAANHALAKKLTERLLQFNAGLMRDIRVKSGRYNQHVSNQCLLVEIGDNKNTFEQAYNAVEYLAQAIADVAGVSYEQDAVQTIYQFTP
ncbi:MAG: stage II sporulation protein P [Clostridiaceae bacterium]|nr:stage II sporulation protein P [Eubacteriales bacterium]